MTRILEVNNLRTQVWTAEGVVKAVDDVSFVVRAGQTLGLVGESGCGKSLTALSILRLVSFPIRIAGGEVWFRAASRKGSAFPQTRAENLVAVTEARMRQIRGAEISMIFQEPMSALNPVMTIGDQIVEAILAHESISGKEAAQRAMDMMRAVAIPAPERRIKEYPHQLSGGLRQRAMIAMALAPRPSLLIADEPTTALDVTIQAQILDLLARLKEEFQLSLVIISHDLGVIAQVADQVCVMYAGKIVEQGATREVFQNPGHPYTEALMKAVPKLDPQRVSRGRLQSVSGSVPDLRTLPPGCAFQPRCKYEMGPKCAKSPIPIIEVSPEHEARCIKHG